MKSITMIHAFWFITLLIASSVAVLANGFLLPTSNAAIPSLDSRPTLIKRHHLLELSSDVYFSISRGGGDGNSNVSGT